MKISVNWMLDHILTPITTIDIGFIVAKFNTRVAEIEHYEKFNLDIDNLFVGQVISIDPSGCVVRCDELGTFEELSFRNDIVVGHYVLIRRVNQIMSWEKLSFYSATKDGLFPPVYCEKSLLSGGWKQTCQAQDFILEVDNKSINHRPDLWGHRGIAQEIAAFMGWKLKSLDQMLAHIRTIELESSGAAGKDFVVDVLLEDTSVCSRFAALYFDRIEQRSSQIWMAIRLACVDSKPINTAVDITNYVMFDISQPMHIFDADYFVGKKLSVRKAVALEKLALLDGQSVALAVDDIVITDGATPVSLAGVMGGKFASFGQKTEKVIIESGSFSAAMVRNSAQRCKVITEACHRFAKQIDPMQNVEALRRFVFLAVDAGIVSLTNQHILSLGKVIQPLEIPVMHSFIQKRLGIQLTVQQIISLLESINLSVQHEQTGDDTRYLVTVPTRRITKDLTIPEDIVEEIGRLYGFENITYQSPTRLMSSFDISQVAKLRTIKNYCAFSLQMNEVKDYPFYDESFVKRLGWYPKAAVAVKNPVSENWKVLVTSLIPHLIKNIELNSHEQDCINLFEHNSVWKFKDDSCQEVIEYKALAGIFFGDKQLDFYDYKQKLVGLFACLRMPVQWVKSQGDLQSWYNPLQVADLMVNGVRIGRAGMVSGSFIRPLLKGSGFIFELQADLLVSFQPEAQKFTPWSKYQAVSVDLSLLVDVTVTAAHLEQAIAQVDTKISNVVLVDFFEKEEWVGKRSLTFRYTISDFDGNVTKETIDYLSLQVIKAMQSQGAEIR
jgi:phenylalanyl-tRNA synthetase beta chain